MRNVLVTGGAGFIGGHLADRLVSDGVSVRVLDDFSTGREANLEGIRSQIKLIRGDLRDAETVDRAVEGVDVLFHLAAVPSVPRSLAEPERTHSVNATGTLQLLEAARRHGVSRVVMASSSSIYGDTEELPKVETMPPRPRSPYALQKFAAEQYGRLYAEHFGLETVALRYFNVFGPRQDPASEYAAVVPRFVLACLKGETPTIYGDGEQTRDFTFVADVVEANLHAARAADVSGLVMNVGGGRQTSLNTLLAMIGELAGTEVKAAYDETRQGDVRDSLADVSLLESRTGFRPAFSLREGLGRTIDHFRKILESGQQV
ncbi:MAG: SDR family oxidoreductase [Myxococcota bacterium]|nr:SDR family oxidoreductase [Myxococcota bacterium]